MEPRVRFTDDLDMSPTRLWVLAVLTAAVMAVYFCVLADTQVNHHEEWLSQSVHSIVRYETVKASRGVVTDRNGRTMISNGFTYDLTFDATLLKKDEDPNDAILRLVRLCISQNRGWTDTLPVTWSAPFSFTVDGLTVEQKRLFLNYLINLRESRDRLSSYLESHRELVDVTDLLPADETESELPSGGEPSSESAALEKAAEQTAEQTASGELSSPGIMDRVNRLLGRGEASDAPVISGRKLLDRLEPQKLSAALLADAGIDAGDFLLWLGREYKIPADYTDAERRSVAGVQYEIKMRNLGDNSVYILTKDVDTEFLSRIADGGYSGCKLINSSVRQYETDAAAHILGTVGSLYKEDLEDPKYADYPLDATIGKSGTEAAFEEFLHGEDGRRVLSVSEDGVITGEYYSKKPEPGSTVELTIDLEFQEAVEAALEETVTTMNEADHQTSRGAGVAVVKVGTGEILALASYPTFTLNDYRTRYSELLKAPGEPLFNRATSGTYPPGSTLKPATAVSALMNGKTTLTTRLYDTGRWHYPGSHLYTNCWYLPGHGSEYLTKAITDSCNYYFAEMGYRLGMDALRETYAGFGLGAHTGIETGDAAGQLPYNPQGQDQAPWAAYGQSNQLYTPLQLANYIATLAAGGKHCEAHLLKAVKSYDSSRVLALGNTAATNTVEIKPEYLTAIEEGMHNLVHGQLWRHFSECVVDAGAKTGTAQLGAGITNNAIFVCFAPYEEPEIALAMVIEKGDTGSKLTSTAVKILNAYFTDDSANAVTGENALLP